jgi:Na+/proline symporter
MFLVVNVLQIFVFDAWNIPFAVTVMIFIVLILLYTLKGGIKTIIWTDTIQTTFMLLALFISIFLIAGAMGTDVLGLAGKVTESDYSRLLFTDWHHKRFFLKELLSGMFIAIVMTGLDQEMMQKNLSCRTLHDAKKNMFTYTGIMVLVNLLILFLGASLYLYINSKGIAPPERSDDLFPMVAINYLGPVAGLVFIIGLISAAYPSADGALTSLTTSFSIDFLGIHRRKEWNEQRKKMVRQIVHVGFALLLLTVIVMYRAINDRAVIEKLFTLAGYTYGPLLGLYAFGLFTSFQVKDKAVPWIAISSPIICYILSDQSAYLFNGYRFGFELLILNGIITFAGLFLFRRNKIAI